MGRLLDSRDVIDANAVTCRAFVVRVVGQWRRAGPNSWDGYDFVYAEDEDEVIKVFPGVRVQIERTGPQLRLRKDGRAVCVRWEDEERVARRDNDRSRREYMLEHLVDPLDGDGKIGAAAVIASKLSG